MYNRKKAHPFYSSKKWLAVRAAYLKTAHYVCEECNRPAEQVHHRDPLEDKDYFVNYEKCYGFSNLIALCRDCHNRKPGHFLAGKGRQQIADGYKVNLITGEIESLPPHTSENTAARKAVSQTCKNLRKES